MDALRRFQCKLVLDRMIDHVSKGGSVGGLSAMKDELMLLLAEERKKNAESKGTPDELPRTSA